MNIRLDSGRHGRAVLWGLAFRLVPAANQRAGGIQDPVKDDGRRPRHGAFGALEAPEMRAVDQRLASECLLGQLAGLAELA
ncbi:hypothetical protein [Streptomyces sp. DSS69]|uniref:hypothetical protein n=1 Tax=Streptomyces sp. DSS69 TaxID=3113369 RepID=UPI0031F93AA7